MNGRPPASNSQQPAGGAKERLSKDAATAAAAATAASTPTEPTAVAPGNRRQRRRMARTARRPRSDTAAATATADAAEQRVVVPLTRPHVWVQLGDGRPSEELVGGAATLAMFDTGANAVGVVSMQELRRLGLARAVNTGGDTPTSLRLLGGNGSIAVVGHAQLPITFAGLDERGRTATVRIDNVALAVVDAPLSPYRMLLGAKFMRAYGDVKLRAAMWKCRTSATTSEGKAIERGLLVPLTHRVEIDSTATGVDVSSDSVEVADLSDTGGHGHLATLLEVAAATDEELGVREANRKPRRQPAGHQEDSALGKSGAAALLELTRDEIDALRVRLGIKTPARAAPMGDEETTRTRRTGGVEATIKVPDDVAACSTADEQFDKLRQAHSDITTEQERADDVDKKTAVVTRWIEAVQRIGEAAAQDDQIGDGVRRLTDAQRRELINEFHQMVNQLYDPRLHHRRRDAHRLPVQVVLDVDRGAKPAKDGMKRGMTVERQLEAHRQLETLVGGGLVELINNPDWVHAVVLARKPDGRWRFAIDYRPLNAALTPQLYPLPDAEELLRFLATKRCFSKMDLADAFYQLELRPDQRHFTAFHVPGRGTYQWRVMAMGLQPATAAWQANMERIFAPLLGHGVLIYVDDLIVYADTPAELLEVTKQVLAIVKKYDLRVSAKKCEWFKEEVSFLGRTVRHGQLAIEDRHIKAIKEYAQPRTVKDLQRFLGMVNFHRHFVRRLGNLVAPMVEMERRSREAGGTAPNGTARKETTIELAWDDAARQAFKELKRALAAPPVLVVPRMAALHRRIRLDTDAATETKERRGGVGGAVFWLDDDGTWRLVMAHSRTLQPAERKYAPVEVEMLGAVELLRAAGWLLRKATGVLLVTDHQALTFIGKMATIEHGRLARWAARLLEFDLTLAYRKGADNVVADALSRAAPGQYDKGVAVRRAMAEVAGAGEVAALVEREAQLDARGAGAARRENDISDELRRVQNLTYDVLMVDPPWKHDSDPVERFYRRMDDSRWPALMKEIDRVAKRDALMAMWVPTCMVQKLFGKVVNEENAGEWHFHKMLTWNRGRSTPSINWPRTTTELLAIFSRGNYSALLDPATKGKLEGDIAVAARETGRKPDEYYELLEAMVRTDQPLRKADIFARQSRHGWDGFGDEKHKFSKDDELAPVTTRRRAAAATAATTNSTAAAPTSPSTTRARSNDTALAGAGAPQKIGEVIEPASAFDEGARDRELLTRQYAAAEALLWTTADDETCLRVATLLENTERDTEWARQTRATATRRQIGVARRWITMHGATLHEDVEIDAPTVQRFVRAHAQSKWPRLRADVQGRRQWCTRNQLRALSEERQMVSGVDNAAVQLWVPHIEVRRTTGADAGTDARRHVLLPYGDDTYRKAVVRRLHQSLGHVGTHKMIHALPNTGWLVDGAVELIAEVLTRCTTCSERKGHPPRAASWKPGVGKQHTRRIVPRAFNDVVHIDFVGPLHDAGGRKRFIVSITDEFTRWPEAAVVDSETAEAAARAFFAGWIARYGQPRKLTSDRGKAFTGEVITELCQWLGIERVRTTAYHPQSNGVEERAHKTIADVMATTISQLGWQPHRWAEALDIALQVLRATVHRSTGFSPSRLVLGFEMAVGDAVLRSASAKKLVDEGVLAFEVRDTIAAAQAADARRRTDLLDVYDRLFKVLDKPLRAMASGDKANDGSGASAENSNRRGNKAQDVRQRDPLAHIQVGDFVRVWLGDGVASDPLVLNPKLAQRRWSPLWRVAEKVRGVSLLLTRADDPMVADTVSGMRVKKIEVEAAKKREYDELYAATMREKEQELKRRRVVRTEMEWEYDGDDPNEEKHELEEIIDVRGVGKHRQVRVRWSDRETTWEPLARIAVDVPALWEQYRARNTRERRQLAQRSVGGGGAARQAGVTR